MNFKGYFFVAALGASLSLCGVASASAGWAANHPRRVEVNHRLANQDARINRNYRDGRITAGQAAYLHGQDRALRSQERFDASFHGGHLTPGQQAALNRRENGVR